jgi:hypothetical protein
MFSKFSPYGNIQNEFPFLGMGNIYMKDLIPNFPYFVAILLFILQFIDIDC